MSSAPFSLGLPVVDQVPLSTGSLVLRSKSKEAEDIKLHRLRGMLTEDDLILVHTIGYRPDHPVPVAMWFSEVKVVMGGAKDGLLKFGFIGWTYVGTGIRKARMIYDEWG